MQLRRVASVVVLWSLGFASRAQAQAPAATAPTPGQPSPPVPTTAPPAATPAPVTPKQDRGTVESGRPDDDEQRRRRSRWHGSTLTLDQSVTTQTVGIGADYQSANSVYEWWIPFRPNYYFYEDPTQSFSVRGWANLYYELTNSDTTTRANQATIGPTFITLPYSRVLRNVDRFKTTMSFGPRFTLPTDQASRNAGQYLAVGASGGVGQVVPLRSDRGAFLSEVRFGLDAIYAHPITRATTPVNAGLQRTRQDLGGRTFLSDQLSPGTNVNHALNIYFSGDFRLLSKLSWNATYVLLNSWLYAPTDAQVCTLTGCVTPDGLADPTTFRPSTWLVTSIDFEATEEVTLSLGYYNRATQLGPGGERRNVLWSSDARFFLSVVGKLDAIYERLKPTAPRQQVGQR